MRAFDTNRDGAIDRAELAKAVEVLKSLDKNGDGKLSHDEYPQPGAFNTIDADKDGFATPKEVRAYFRNRNNPR